MAHITVTLNKKHYEIACDDGQEAHLMRLAEFVDKRVAELTAAVGQVGEARLLVMASLLVADELSDAHAELEELRKANAGVAALMEVEDALAERIEKMADRIENIAKKMEQA